MTITEDQLEELKELLDRHDEDSDCHRTGGCCADLLIELLRELIEDE